MDILELSFHNNDGVFEFSTEKLYCHPNRLISAARHINTLTKNVKFDVVCGVADDFRTLAGVYAVSENVPLISVSNVVKGDSSTYNEKRVLLFKEVYNGDFGDISDTIATLHNYDFKVVGVATMIHAECYSSTIVPIYPVVSYHLVKLFSKFKENGSNVIASLDCTDPEHIISSISKMGKSVCAFKINFDIVVWTDKLIREFRCVVEEQDAIIINDGRIAYLPLLAIKKTTLIDSVFGKMIHTVVPVFGDRLAHELANLVPIIVVRDVPTYSRSNTEYKRMVDSIRGKNLVGMISQYDTDGTPWFRDGVHLAKTRGEYGERYVHPSKANCDFMIVEGLDICDDPEKEVRKYINEYSI